MSVAFAAPELAHQFHVRLHFKTRELTLALDRYCMVQQLPGPIVTAVSRDPSFYEDHRFSWHLVDCAVDLRNRHYTPGQRDAVESWLAAKCASSEWELITHDHGTGPHIHVAYREFGLRKIWDRAHLKPTPTPEKP